MNYNQRKLARNKRGLAGWGQRGIRRSDLGMQVFFWVLSGPYCWAAAAQNLTPLYHGVKFQAGIFIL